jgi:hypothetical protein
LDNLTKEGSGDAAWATTPAAPTDAQAPAVTPSATTEPVATTVPAVAEEKDSTKDAEGAQG